MLQLRCAAQNYEWGRPAQDSEVAKLVRANGSNIDEAKPFAELWMGAHPNCPSRLQASGLSLQEFLERHPEVLGPEVYHHFDGQLPFLLKVLSVNKALSIQSHPDKELAQRLHARSPKLYPDPNHKPEMALALSDFAALCGFASTPLLAARLRAVPELAELVGRQRVERLLALAEAGLQGQGQQQGLEAVDEQTKEALRSAFAAVMTAPPAAVADAVARLAARLRARAAAGEALDEHEALALRLDEQFPGGDVGVLSAFFLNLVRLPPGHALYLPANEPHAYLAGELVEVMAASDNVIRAGLTPKFKDAEVLVESLTYRQGVPEVLEGTEEAPCSRVYRPPFDEFEIHRVECGTSSGSSSRGDSVHLGLGSEGPRLLLVQHGTGRLAAGHVPEALCGVADLEREVALRRGSVVLVPAGAEVSVEDGEGLVAWVAAVNASFFVARRAAVAAVAEALGAAVVDALGDDASEEAAVESLASGSTSLSAASSVMEVEVGSEGGAAVVVTVGGVGREAAKSPGLAVQQPMEAACC